MVVPSDTAQEIIDAAKDVVFTRDEAIRWLGEALQEFSLSRGKEVAQFLGADIAAGLTVASILKDKAALTALGVTQDDLDRVFEA